MAAQTKTREASSISFPYRDLETGIGVADAMLKAGGVPLSSDQLAGVMELKPGSGNFVLKVATARLFGLITNTQGKYELTNLGFSIVDKDEKRQRAARAEAFLNVQLYRRAYEEFKGKQLPPRPLGLENAFVKFGVSPKQKEAARQIFDKSARQAGFFSAGEERLIEPIVGAPIMSQSSGDDESAAAESATSSVTMGPIMSKAASKGGLHPFIQGLLDTLPAPETNWTVEGRAKWLQAAAHCFDLIYMGSGEVLVTAKAAPEPASTKVSREKIGD